MQRKDCRSTSRDKSDTSYKNIKMKIENELTGFLSASCV